MDPIFVFLNVVWLFYHDTISGVIEYHDVINRCLVVRFAVISIVRKVKAS